MLFEALPIIIVTALVIEAVSYFIPAVKNLVGVVGPILIVLGAMGWRLLGSSHSCRNRSHRCPLHIRRLPG